MYKLTVGDLVVVLSEANWRVLPETKAYLTGLSLRGTVEDWFLSGSASPEPKPTAREAAEMMMPPLSMPIRFEDGERGVLFQTPTEVAWEDTVLCELWCPAPKTGSFMLCYEALVRRQTPPHGVAAEGSDPAEMQRAFVGEYVKHRDPAKAALAAGYDEGRRARALADLKAGRRLTVSQLLDALIARLCPEKTTNVFGIEETRMFRPAQPSQGFIVFNAGELGQIDWAADAPPESPPDKEAGR